MSSKSTQTTSPQGGREDRAGEAGRALGVCRPAVLQAIPRGHPLVAPQHAAFEKLLRAALRAKP